MYGQTCLKVGTKASWAPSFREALGLVPRCSLSFGLLKTPHHFASAHNAVSTTIYLGALQIASQTLSTRRLWGVHPQLPWLRAGAVERSMGEEGKSLGTPRPSKYESLRPSSSLPRPWGSCTVTRTATRRPPGKRDRRSHHQALGCSNAI